jgi:hypothetical protein
MLTKSKVKKNMTRGLSRKRWMPESDVFEIVFGYPAEAKTSIPAGILVFVSEIVESGLWSRSRTGYSFRDIFEILLNIQGCRMIVRNSRCARFWEQSPLDIYRAHCGTSHS